MVSESKARRKATLERLVAVLAVLVEACADDRRSAELGQRALSEREHTSLVVTVLAEALRVPDCSKRERRVRHCFQSSRSENGTHYTCREHQIPSRSSRRTSRPFLVERRLLVVVRGRLRRLLRQVDCKREPPRSARRMSLYVLRAGRA